MKPGYRSSELILPPYEQPTGSGFGFGMGAGRGNVGVGLGSGFPLTADGFYPAWIAVSMNPL